MKIAAVAAVLLCSLSSVALAQGGGSGGSSGGSAGSGSSSTSGSSATGGTNQVTPPNTGTTGQNSHINNTQDQMTGPAAQQLQRNRGMGTAPNGRPVGTPGSGLGSPEQPHDEGARR